jgi:GT2 family glycosyltransferase
VRTCFPAARLIVNGANAGFARANNQALRQISAEYALLLNPDAALQPHTLRALWAFTWRAWPAGCTAGISPVTGLAPAALPLWPIGWAARA